MSEEKKEPLENEDETIQPEEPEMEETYTFTREQVEHLEQTAKQAEINREKRTPSIRTPRPIPSGNSWRSTITWSGPSIRRAAKIPPIRRAWK